MSAAPARTTLFLCKITGERANNVNGKMVRLLWLLASPAVALLLTVTFACNHRSAHQGQRDPQEMAARTAAASPRSEGVEINLQCDADRIRNAPAPFHWSFRKTVPPLTSADWEADVTPNSIAGTVIDSSGTHAIHGARPDSTSWDTAVMILAEPLPTSAFALVNNSSGIERAGTESVNGQDTIKYTIDTSHDTAADASLIRSVLGAAGFIKGAAWVNARGCPVKFVLDVEQHNNDGSVQKEHYEASVTRP